MPTKAERRLIRQWEETLITDYDDYWSHKLLDPLYAQFQQWNAGQMPNDNLFQAIHEVHRANRERYNFFVLKREQLVRNIQLDPWFNHWLEQHPAPVGADILPEELKPHGWEEMEAMEGDVPGEEDDAAGTDTPADDEDE